MLAYMIMRKDTPVTGSIVHLGQLGYDIEPIQAPVARTHLLRIISYILTESPIGPWTRRILLDGNKVSLIRELAAQISFSPMYYPLRLKDSKTTKREKEFQNKSVGQVAFEAFSIPEKTMNVYSSIETYAKYYLGGVLPSEVMKRTIAAVNDLRLKGLVIFSSLNESDILYQAKQSDERFQNGKQLSLLDGVPVCIKDAIPVRGHIIYGGKSPLERYKDGWMQGNDDDIIVARLRSMGAIIFGVSISVEGGTTPLGYNAHFKGPHSAYSSNRYSGGSSSGSAVAVSTGLMPVGIGFDGGGSVRLPAAMSGVQGLAVTFSAIPFDTSVGCETNVKTGPITGTVADAAFIYALLAQPAAGSFFTSLHGPVGPPLTTLHRFHDIDDLNGIRIGIYEDWFNDASESVKRRCHEVVSYLKDRGVEVVPISIPHMQLLSLSHALKISSEFAIAFDQFYHVKEDPLAATLNKNDDELPRNAWDGRLEPNTRIVVGLGMSSTAMELLAVEKIRHWAFEYFTKKLFEDLHLDAIVSPSLGLAAPVLSEEAKIVGESDTVLGVKVIRHAFLANFLGLPGHSVAVGHVPAEEDPELMLPVGFQLMGDHWSEAILLRLAHSIEQGFTNQLPKIKPKFFYDPFSFLNQTKERNIRDVSIHEVPWVYH